MSEMNVPANHCNDDKSSKQVIPALKICFISYYIYKAFTPLPGGDDQVNIAPIKHFLLNIIHWIVL